MTSASSVNWYGIVSQFLHWITALLVIVGWSLGAFGDDLPKGAIRAPGADLPPPKSARWGRLSMPWRRTGCACWASPQPRRRTAVFRPLRPNSPSDFLASSVLRIRFAKACRTRSAIAAPPASASS